MSILKKTLLLPLLLLAFESDAQTIYPAAITKNGILLGRYKTANDATNAIAESITLEEARNIVSINALQLGKDQKLQKAKVISYQMTIYEPGDTLTLLNTGEQLSQEMKSRLAKIKPGAKLLFEGIKVEFTDGESRMIVMLSFAVK